MILRGTIYVEHREEPTAHVLRQVVETETESPEAFRVLHTVRYSEGYNPTWWRVSFGPIGKPWGLR